MNCLICQKNKATIGTENHGAYLCQECVDLSEKAKCPECGKKVFIPMIGWIRNQSQVLCSDMGHWFGLLSDCKFSGEQKENRDGWLDDWM